MYLDKHYDVLRDEIIPILKSKQHDVRRILRSKVHLLADMDYGRQFGPEFLAFEDYSQKRKHTLTTLFEIEADAILKFYSPLCAILKHDFGIPYARNYKAIRGALEQVLSENPFLELIGQSDILDLSVKVDSALAQEHQFTRCSQGYYIMDTELHTHSGHTDYALHFVLPLLLECGMYFSREDLTKVSQEEQMHSGEREYLQRCITEPRSLKKRCRDILRRIYKGPKIHAFLAAASVPTPIRNFLLLKEVLLML